MKIIASLFVALLAGVCSVQAQVYSGSGGTVSMKGVAPLETIVASSTSLEGLLDAGSKEFNFRQPLNKFAFSQGALQKQHAEENYFEVEKFSHAKFKGSIMGEANFKADGTYQVTAKGVFSLHGVDKNLKTPATVEVKGGKIKVKASFKAYLSDHDIKIPKLVAQKVSDEFEVNVELNLEPKK
jgi:hypothetical protein